MKKSEKLKPARKSYTKSHILDIYKTHTRKRKQILDILQEQRYGMAESTTACEHVYQMENYENVNCHPHFAVDVIHF